MAALKFLGIVIMVLAGLAFGFGLTYTIWAGGLFGLKIYWTAIIAWIFGGILFLIGDW